MFAVRQRVGQGKEDAREQPSTVAARQPCLVQTMSELGDLVVPGLALVEVDVTPASSASTIASSSNGTGSEPPPERHDNTNPGFTSINHQHSTRPPTATMGR